MRALLVFVIVALASVCTAQQPKPQPLEGKELADFLGGITACIPLEQVHAH